MAELTAPFPPGSYPVVVIGSGPGAIQVSYSLRHLGVEHAVISADPDLLDSFRVDGHAPRTALVITVEAAYFQCARAIIRARLWEPDARVDPADLPSPGAILAALTAGEVGGQVYDAEWPGRAAKTMW